MLKILLRILLSIWIFVQAGWKTRWDDEVHFLSVFSFWLSDWSLHTINCAKREPVIFRLVPWICIRSQNLQYVNNKKLFNERKWPTRLDSYLTKNTFSIRRTDPTGVKNDHIVCIESWMKVGFCELQAKFFSTQKYFSHFFNWNELQFRTCLVISTNQSFSFVNWMVT